MQTHHERYIELGRKAAMAGNLRDNVLETVFTERFRRAIQQEVGLGRKQAELLFNESYLAYRTGRRILE